MRTVMQKYIKPLFHWKPQLPWSRVFFYENY
nr:hypothetical protein DLTAUQXX_DLTAUQXX_CDS_0053 [uncultured phage]CAI9750149.1 hypothetical protein LUIDIZRK_LUIDIZRK_CDS_0053 [uncultured phage]